MSRIRRICLALVLFFCAAAAWAETTFYVGFSETLGWADIREYVYLYPSYQKLSELDWDAHKVPQLGMELEFTHNRFFFTADVAASGSADCGYMQDYDWFYLYVTNPAYPINTVTEFSEHPLTLLAKNRFGVNAGWTLFDGRRFSFALGGGFLYQYTYLEGHGGYLQHSFYENREKYGYTNENVSPYDPSRPKVTIGNETKVISYQQKIESLWIDARVTFHLSPAFSFALEGGISPWQMISCDDYHFTGDNNHYVWYLDKPDSSIMYRASVSAICSFTKRSGVVLSGSVLSLPYADGNNYMNGSENPTAVLGGTGYFGWDVSLSYRIRIF